MNLCTALYRSRIVQFALIIDFSQENGGGGSVKKPLSVKISLKYANAWLFKCLIDYINAAEAMKCLCYCYQKSWLENWSTFR